MSVTYRRYGTGRSYRIDGKRVPGVTTITGVLDKPALQDWAGRATAGYAVDHWEELSALPPSKRLERLNKARFEERDAAANRGMDVHALGERLARDEEVEVPEEIEGHVAAYAKFLDERQVGLFAAEMTVANRLIGYAGQLDLLATMDGQPDLWLIDLKTGGKGIFPETALQLCGYRHAEVLVDDLGAEQPMPRVAGCLAVWVRADSYQVVPVETGPEVWDFFRHLAWIERRVEDMREWVGRPDRSRL